MHLADALIQTSEVQAIHFIISTLHELKLKQRFLKVGYLAPYKIQ